MPPSTTMAVHASCLSGNQRSQWLASSRSGQQCQTIQRPCMTPAGSQAAPRCIPRRPACIERSIASDPDRRRVVPQTGDDDSRNGSARCQRQSSRDTCGPRRSPSFSMCHPRRSAVGPRRAGCPTSAPWAATDATPTPRSGPCWKPCPSHPRPASRQARPNNRSVRARAWPCGQQRRTPAVGHHGEAAADLQGDLQIRACRSLRGRPLIFGDLLACTATAGRQLGPR
jgi:hypothetical protein